MRRVALDTNVVSKLLRGDHAGLEKTFDEIDTYYIPWVVHAELLGGIYAGLGSPKYLGALEVFFGKRYVETSTTFAEDTVPFYAEIYAYLKKNGTPVSPNDLWIAAECAANGIPLFTLDSDFKKIPQVLLFR